VACTGRARPMASAAAGEARSGDGGARLGREGGGDRRLGSAQRARQAAATGISTHAEPAGEALQLSALRLTDERDDVPVAAARSAGGRGVGVGTDGSIDVEDVNDNKIGGGKRLAPLRMPPSAHASAGQLRAHARPLRQLSIDSRSGRVL
jgi:hypothetical protein